MFKAKNKHFLLYQLDEKLKLDRDKPLFLNKKLYK